MVCIEGDGIELRHIVFNTQSEAAVNISNSRHLYFNNITFSNTTKTALNIEGSKTSMIRFILSDVSKLSNAFSFGKEVLLSVLIQK